MKLYDAIQSKTLRRTAVAAGVLALAGGASVIWFMSSAATLNHPLSIAVMFLAGATVFATPAVAAGLVLHFLDEHQRQTAAMIAIRPLMGDLPLPLGRWAIDAHFGELVVRHITGLRPTLVVECGAGTSTVLAAECLRRLGNGRVVSFEHNPEFAEVTRRRLADRGLESFATVVTAPITSRSVDGEQWDWYDDNADQTIDAPIDLLVIDGPNRQLGREARFPAVPILHQRLAPDATILMDDGNRSDESRIAFKWARRLNASLERVRGGKGAWILQRGRTTA